MDKDQILGIFGAAAQEPLAYARAWKEKNQRPVIGSFPMNFPGELAHAAGALPVILQESPAPITFGHGMLFPFYCGYTRSIVDQAMIGEFKFLDAIMFGDSYADTLRQWRARFLAAWTNIERLGFDERFRRMWEMYLAYCEGGFRAHTINVGQFKLVRE